MGLKTKYYTLFVFVVLFSSCTEQTKEVDEDQRVEEVPSVLVKKEYFCDYADTTVLREMVEDHLIALGNEDYTKAYSMYSEFLFLSNPIESLVGNTVNAEKNHGIVITSSEGGLDSIIQVRVEDNITYALVVYHKMNFWELKDNFKGNKETFVSGLVKRYPKTLQLSEDKLKGDFKSHSFFVARKLEGNDYWSIDMHEYLLGGNLAQFVNLEILNSYAVVYNSLVFED